MMTKNVACRYHRVRRAASDEAAGRTERSSVELVSKKCLGTVSSSRLPGSANLPHGLPSCKDEAMKYNSVYSEERQVYKCICKSGQNGKPG